MTADVHALTGAYVLDAVSDTERAEFERHLRECETCSREVYELRETATRLGRAAAAVPPARLKGAVMAGISQVRQDPPQATVTPLRRRRTSWTLRLSSAAAAVLLVATTVLGVLLVQARDAAEISDAQAAAMTTILGAGDARVTSQGDETSGRMTVLSSRAVDRAMLLAENLPDPGPDRDYQAWTMGDEIRSAGLLPNGGTTTLAVDGLDSAALVGITVEPTGGSDQPSSDPVMEFELS